MLRFNLKQEADIWIINRFQYILCYGSTLQQGHNVGSILDFNTSYVTVQRKASF